MQIKCVDFSLLNNSLKLNKTNPKILIRSYGEFADRRTTLIFNADDCYLYPFFSKKYLLNCRKHEQHTIEKIFRNSALLTKLHGD